MSLGTPVRGRLVRAVPLPRRGLHYITLARTRNRRAYYGTSELVQLIRRAARKVARRYPGSRLSVGNLSHRAGGWLSVSRSHQSGRDVDLAFYARFRGRPVTVRHFIRFGPSLRSRYRRHLAFDVPRTWALVQALLSDGTIPVQWLIIAPHLRRALLAYAKQQKVDGRLLARARRTLYQPPGVALHDNHLHLRIYCSREDLLVGCRDLPPFWPHARRYKKDWQRRVLTLVRGLSDSVLQVRQRVLTYLTRLYARSALGKIAEIGLRDPKRRFRRRVFALLEKWQPWPPAAVKAVARFLWRDGAGFWCPRQPKSSVGCPRHHAANIRGDRLRSARQIRLAYRALGRARSLAVSRLIRKGLRSSRWIRHRGPRVNRLPEALLAARAARYQEDVSLVAPLIPLLRHRHGPTRAVAAESLAYLTNHSFHIAWQRNRSWHRQRLAARRWRRWWRAHRVLDRDTLMDTGFRRRFRGFGQSSTRRRLSLLVRLTRGRGFLAENAHQRLRRIRGPAVFQAPPTRRTRYAYWRRWLQRTKPPKRALQGPRWRR